jgi:hypothetical protein
VRVLLVPKKFAGPAMPCMRLRGSAMPGAVHSFTAEAIAKSSSCRNEHTLALARSASITVTSEPNVPSGKPRSVGRCFSRLALRLTKTGASVKLGTAVAYNPLGVGRMVALRSAWWQRCQGTPAANRTGRGKSGLHRTRWWVTPTGREARESATESIPPMAR